jgi:adenine phosphoribosyltransferase
VTEGELSARIDAAIGHVADFPTPGFPFRDVTPLLEDDAGLFKEIVDAFCVAFEDDRPDRVLCIESFGYVFGAPIAYRLGTPLVLARRAGKLPRPVHRYAYDMIYESGKCLEVHQGAIRPGDRVLIVDDVLASGGSAIAAVELVEASGAEALALACVADVVLLGTAPQRVALDERGIRIVALATL